MSKLTPQDWGAVLILFLMFAFGFLANRSGLVDQLNQPIMREPIQELPVVDGGAEVRTSYTDPVSRAKEPFRLRPRI